MEKWKLERYADKAYFLSKQKQEKGRGGVPNFLKQ